MVQGRGFIHYLVYEYNPWSVTDQDGFLEHVGLIYQREWFGKNRFTQLPLLLQLIEDTMPLADILRITELFFKCMYEHSL